MDTQIVVDKVRELHEKMEQNAISDVERKTLAGLNDKLDAQETKNQEITQQIQEHKEREQDFIQRMDDIETHLMTQKAGQSVDFRNSDEYKALVQGLRFGMDKVDPEYKTLNLLRSDNDTSGGMLATETISDQILEPIIEMSPFRRFCTVISINTKTLTMPTYLGTIQCEWEGEAEESIDTTAGFGTQSVTPFRLSTTVPVTIDMLMNASFDIESYIMSKANEAFALKENHAFARGTGVKQPMGFMSKAEIVGNARETEDSGAINGDDIFFLLGDLKAGYNEMLGMNRRTLAYLRTLKDGNGQYLWSPALDGSVTNTIAGTPYFIAPDLDDIGAGKYPIVLADWKRGYQIVDRTGVSFVRDEITQKRKAIVEITVHKWLTGAPVIMEAWKLLKIKA